ncbi:hypothetical protein COBT_000957 [Conglomerata obtusa]
MVSIKGPRSALTDFIEEHGLKIKTKRKQNKETSKNQPVAKPTRVKRIKFNQPIELTNIDKQDLCDEELFFHNLHIQIQQMRIDGCDMLNITKSVCLDEQRLFIFAQFLSRNRLMDTFYYDLFVSCCSHELRVYDCSMIRDYNVYKDLRVIELHSCGQLTENSLNEMLSFCTNLEVLIITGAYLIESIEIPSTVKYIDLTHCSRLCEKFVDFLNETFTHLDVLILSFCYGIKKFDFKFSVKELFLCETLVDESSLLEMPGFYDLEKLSFKRCSNVFSIEDKNYDNNNLSDKNEQDKNYDNNNLSDNNEQDKKYDNINLSDNNEQDKNCMDNPCDDKQYDDEINNNDIINNNRIDDTINNDKQNDDERNNNDIINNNKIDDTINNDKHTTNFCDNNKIDFSKFTKLKYLDIEGISTLNEIKLPSTIKTLNISYCYNINFESLGNLIEINELNLSRINYIDLSILINFKKLKILNIGWSTQINDESLLRIIDACQELEEITVFGCFNLSEKIGKIAWERKHCLKIIGNPSETQYLLEN